MNLAVLVTAVTVLASLVANAQESPAKLIPPIRPEIITDCDTPGGYGRLYFPGGVAKALTMSFDDGRIYDYKLVERLDHFGLRATFHLVSGLLNKPDYVKSADVKTIYARHEIASHTVTHADLRKR